MKSLPSILCLAAIVSSAIAGEQYSGIYPHLAYFNDESECGTGAVVPWAERLWVITYGPHQPLGSSDKLYEITPDLRLKARPESVGGTPANRMIHRESKQLNIGPYFIDEQRKVRVIPPKSMPGRLTGTARHLTDPANKLYIATMEEGLYEVDVHTLEVVERIKDGNAQPAIGDGLRSELPGYHGKGLYCGQEILVYANNGEKSDLARRDPFVPSGALATWNGSGDWDLVCRNQFTEVTGPGGIYGNSDVLNDPVWSIGWDARSLMLMCLERDTWHMYRLPKASHSYDGAHGWNTEWPRIRDIGEDDLLMTMHGMFWRFPKTFTPTTSAGIAPRSTYLKVVGDFCRWQDRIVLGCDDTARKEFLNQRRAKGKLPEPQSQSNLWFLEPEQLDQLGPVIGRGAIWLNDAVQKGTPSDPFLIDGFAKRALHLVVDQPATLTLEIDAEGNGNWTQHEVVEVDGYLWKPIDPSLDAVWIRLRSSVSLRQATAWFHFSGEETRPTGAMPTQFAGLARIGDRHVSGGVVHAQADNQRTLHYAASVHGERLGYYKLDDDMNLVRTVSKRDEEWLRRRAAIPNPAGILELDDASAIYVDDEAKRFRIPRNPSYDPKAMWGPHRICREVATERDLFNCFGTFFELPARNAGGFRRIRPVSSHNLAIEDYCSYRGLLVLAGVNLDAAANNPHIIRSDDGKTGLWVGAIDDLWSLGKPVGIGGPWKDTKVTAGNPSDPYLITGYDKKSLTLESSSPCRVTAEIDVTGMDQWHPYRSFDLSAMEAVHYEFPDAFQAYWIRFRTNEATTVSAQLLYE